MKTCKRCGDSSASEYTFFRRYSAILCHACRRGWELNATEISDEWAVKKIAVDCAVSSGHVGEAKIRVLELAKFERTECLAAMERFIDGPAEEKE